MKSILLLLAIVLLNMPTINCQNQTNMKETALIIPQITPDFEKLDTLEYLQIKEKDENYGEKILSDGTSIYIKVLPTSYFAIIKNYYLNENIKVYLLTSKIF